MRKHGLHLLHCRDVRGVIQFQNFVPFLFSLLLGLSKVLLNGFSDKGEDRIRIITGGRFEDAGANERIQSRSEPIFLRSVGGSAVQ